MNVRALLIASIAAGALASASQAPAAPAAAAPAAAQPAAPTLSHGPPISGMCIVGVNKVMGASKVGQAVMARLKVLGSQVNAELQPEAEGIRAEQQTLQSQQSSMDGATLQAKRAALELRYSNFQKRAQQREQELQATQQKQLNTVLRELYPIMGQIYQQHRCSMLLDAEQGGVLFANPAMDISAESVTGLDARIQTLTFDREHLDTQTPGAAPAAR